MLKEIHQAKTKKKMTADRNMVSHKEMKFN